MKTEETPVLAKVVAAVITLAALIFLGAMAVKGLDKLDEWAGREAARLEAEHQAEGPKPVKLPQTIPLNKGLDGSCTLDPSVPLAFLKGSWLESDKVSAGYNCETKGPIWVNFSVDHEGRTNFNIWFPRVKGGDPFQPGNGL